MTGRCGARHPKRPESHVIIVCLDFVAIYLLTGTAAAFMIVSNIYTTVGYFLHERVWAGITWGMELQRDG